MGALMQAMVLASMANSYFPANVVDFEVGIIASFGVDNDTYDPTKICQCAQCQDGLPAMSQRFRRVGKPV